MELLMFQHMFSSASLYYQISSCSCNFCHYLAIIEGIVPIYLEIVFEESELVQTAF